MVYTISFPEFLELFYQSNFKLTAENVDLTKQLKIEKLNEKQLTKENEHKKGQTQSDQSDDRKSFGQQFVVPCPHFDGKCQRVFILAKSKDLNTLKTVQINDQKYVRVYLNWQEIVNVINKDKNFKSHMKSIYIFTIEFSNLVSKMIIQNTTIHKYIGKKKILVEKNDDVSDTKDANGESEKSSQKNQVDTDEQNEVKEEDCESMDEDDQEDENGDVDLESTSKARGRQSDKKKKFQFEKQYRDIEKLIPMIPHEFILQNGIQVATTFDKNSDKLFIKEGQTCYQKSFQYSIKE